MVVFSVFSAIIHAILKLRIYLFDDIGWGVGAVEVTV